MEGWQEYYTDAEIKKIQEIELETLRVFKEICKKLNIEFFLYGGSLLGAVKYQGFVPWDDDLDLALLRDDYEKLIQQGKQYVPEGYELQHPKLNKKTPYPYIKFRRSGTTMVEYVNMNIKMNHGIYLDVYPIDHLPDDADQINHARQEMLKVVTQYQIRQGTTLPLMSKNLKYFLHKMYRFSKKIVYKMIPRKRFIQKMDEIMTRYNDIDTHYQGNLFFPRPTNYFDGIHPLISVSFEGMEMKIPQGYLLNLTNRYGDINQLPPEEERVGHKPYCLSFGKDVSNEN